MLHNGTRESMRLASALRGVQWADDDTAMNAVDESNAGTASRINNTVLRVAGLLAVAVFGAVLSSIFQSDPGRR